MATIPVAIGLIQRLLPALGVLAPALYFASQREGLLGQVESALGAVDRAIFPDFLPHLGQLRGLIGRAQNSQAYQEARGPEAPPMEMDVAEVDLAFKSYARAQAQMAELPTFASRRDAEAWWFPISDAIDEGLLREEEVDNLRAHYLRELARLESAARPAAGIVAEAPRRAAEAAAPAVAAPSLEGVSASLGGIATILGTLVTAQTAVASAIKNQHRDRQACVQSTGQVLLTALAPVLGVGGVGLLALSTERGREAVDIIIGKAWDLAFDARVVPLPADPDRALEAARTLFIEKATLGAAAHLLAVAAEANANIKHLGVGFLAAFLSDLAGFGRLAQLTMGEVEQAALGLPMRRKANRDYRPNNPPIPDLGMGYAKKEITRKQLADTLAEYGMRQEWVDMYSSHLFLDPTLSMIIRLGQFFHPGLREATRKPHPIADAWIKERPWLLEDAQVTQAEWDLDWWFWYKMAKSGFEAVDMRMGVETAKLAIVRREQALGLEAISRMHRNGHIDTPRLKELAQELWGVIPGPDGKTFFSADPVYARIRATELRTQSEDLEAHSELALQALAHGLLSPVEAAEQLAALGMPADKAQRVIIRQQLGLVPRTSLEAVGAGQRGGAGGTGEDGEA